jgi:hypothetical protein
VENSDLFEEWYGVVIELCNPVNIVPTSPTDIHQSTSINSSTGNIHQARNGQSVPLVNTVTVTYVGALEIM